MKKIIQKVSVFALILITAVSFSMGATVDSTYAVSKPAKVTSVKVKTLSKSSIKITWAKAKHAKGYAVYRHKT